MLFITRKINESVVINHEIELKVLDIKGRTVKLGFEYPPEASVLRKELFDKIMQENIEAAKSAGLGDFDGIDGEF